MIATVVFLALTAVMLAVAPPDLVSDLGPAESLPRLFVLVAGVAGVFFLLVGPFVALCPAVIGQHGRRVDSAAQ